MLQNHGSALRQMVLGGHAGDHLTRVLPDWDRGRLLLQNMHEGLHGFLPLY